MTIDFEAFEKAVYEKFKNTLVEPEDGKPDYGLSKVIGLYAARVATLAIKEYHDQIQQNEVEKKVDL